MSNKFTDQLVLFDPAIAPAEEIHPDEAAKLYALRDKDEVTAEDLRPILESMEKNKTAGRFAKSVVRGMIGVIEETDPEKLAELDNEVLSAFTEINPDGLANLLNEVLAQIDPNQFAIQKITIYNPDGSVRTIDPAKLDLESMPKGNRTLH